MHVKCLSLWEFDTCSPFGGLRCVSFFGIVELVAALIEMECNGADESDFSGYTPLASAAQNGHAVVREILFEREEVDYCTTNQMISAKYRSHMLRGLVKILLMREEVNLDWPSNDG